MDNNTNSILKHRRHNMDVVMAASRTDKLIKISSFMSCRILSCVCQRWICNEKIDKPSMNSICEQSCCNHKLYDHVSHLVHAPEKMLNVLMRLIIEFESINYEIQYLSKFPSDREINAVLNQCKNIICNEMKHFINPKSMVSIEDSMGTPPFESPAIVDVFKHFCLLKFSPSIFYLKLAFKISRIVLKKFEQWTWATPEKLPSLSRLKFNNSYTFYYQRYQEHCLTPNSNHCIIKPSYTSSIIFGQDILKYTLKVFRPSITNWCIGESKNCTYSKKCLFMKLFPEFLDILEQEVYAVDSPICNPNFMNTQYPKGMLDSLNLKLNKLAQSQFNAPRMNSNIPGRINNNCLNGVTLQVPEVKYDEIFKKYVATDTIFDIFECIHFSVGAKISLKGFITSQNKRRTQVKSKHIGIEVIVFDHSSNLIKCVLWQKELRNMYLSRLPRLPDAYIARLQTDEKIKTLAMLEDGIPVGGIYFRTFNSQGFTEIVLCMFKVDLHVIGYESRLMNYLKDLHIKQNIWDLLVYADKDNFAFYKNHNFSSEVKISKTIYNKYIIHYEDSKLMHCNLKK